MAVGAVGEQAAHRLDVVLDRGDLQRRARRSDEVDVGAARDEELDEATDAPFDTARLSGELPSPSVQLTSAPSRTTI